tara:strand:+ start:1039 stop:1251 length:213 start_codon:yes stop_codon:yes gene_type:complete
MLPKEIKITNYLFETIATLYSEAELNNYIKKNPNTFADNIEIDNISFLGFDEIEYFFKCKNLNQFYKLIN